MSPQRSIDRIAAILDDIGESGKLDGHFAASLQDERLKVEHLPIALVYPDPAQPRRVLPEAIYSAFYQQHLTPVQALREFIQRVGVLARQKGRPFSNILDLLPNADEEGHEPDLSDGKLTPEESLLRELVTLAVTIRDDGQVNPLTVIDKSQGVSQLFKIETGERRYWATWLMMEFLPGYQGDGTLPCLIVPSQTASVFRQAKENTSRAGLNAIALARQAALLILHVHGIEPPDDGPVANAFYRQALTLDLRGKREFTDEILAAMGGISRVHFSRYKALLQLSDEALELADRCNLDEGRLRFVITLPLEQHLEMIRQIVDFNLTMKQIRELCEEDFENERKDHDPYPREVVQFVKAIQMKDSGDAYDALQLLLEKEQDKHLARARLLRHKQLIEEMLGYLEE